MSGMKRGSVRVPDRPPPPMADSASSSRTDLPALVRTMAAASPFGPAPTTIASTRLSAKIDDGALGGGFDRDRVAAMGRDDRINLVVGPRRIVLKQHQPFDAGRLGETDGVFDGRVTKGRERRELGPGQLRVMDQQIRRSRQGNRGGVIRAEPSRSGPDRDRAVVREIGDRCPGAGHPISIGEAALVGDLPRDDIESLDRPGTLLDSEEAPFAAELGWLDREMWWRHDAGQDVGRITLRRHDERDLGVGPVASGKEWDPVGVVPMQVTEEDRASKRPPVQQGGQALQAGAGVEHQRWALPVMGERNTGSVAFISHELRPRRRRRTSHTAYEQADRRGVYGLQPAAKRWTVRNGTS